MHRPCGLFAESGRHPPFYVGELVATMPVNREVPNLGPRISIVTHEGKLLGASATSTRAAPGSVHRAARARDGLTRRPLRRRGVLHRLVAGLPGFRTATRAAQPAQAAARGLTPAVCGPRTHLRCNAGTAGRPRDGLPRARDVLVELIMLSPISRRPHAPTLPHFGCADLRPARYCAVARGRAGSVGDRSQPRATWQRGETFYVRVAYQNDRPLRIRIRGLRQGKTVPTMTRPISSLSTRPAAKPSCGSPRSARHSRRDSGQRRGSGNWKIIAQTTSPVNLEWTGMPATTPRQQADWARTISQAQQQLISQEMRKYSEGGGFMDTLLGLVIMLRRAGLHRRAGLVVEMPRGRLAHSGVGAACRDGRRAGRQPLRALPRQQPVANLADPLAPLALIWLGGLMLLHRSTATA